MKRRDDHSNLPPQAQIDAVTEAMLATDLDVVLWHRETVEELAVAAIDAMHGRSIGSFGAGASVGLIFALVVFVAFKVFM